MPAVLFRCPIKGVTVQGWAPDLTKEDTVAFVSVQCVACGLAHYVNPKTGKRLGEEQVRSKHTL